MYDITNRSKNMSEKITTVAAEVEKMKAWCMDNYENGADTMVECWGNEDYERMFAYDDYSKRTPTVAEAWDVLKSVAEVYLDRQADARNSSF